MMMPPRISNRMPKRLIIGGGISLLMLVMATLAFIWTPHDPTAIDISARFLKPSQSHLLGTDHFGRDIISMLMAGAGVTLSVAFAAVFIGVLVGVPLGILAAERHGRRLDNIVMRGNDLIFAFPALVIAILITARFGPSVWNAVLAIGIFNIPVFTRVARAAALPVWQRDFILSARLAGKTSRQIAHNHVFPNIRAMLLMQATIQFSLAILAEAGLSYIGLGVSPPQASWGRILAEGQTMVALSPIAVLAPGMLIVLAVLGFNLLGDGLGEWLVVKGGRRK